MTSRCKKNALLLLAALYTAGCAGTPSPPEAGKSHVWGYVQLVPHPDYTPSGGVVDDYSDRRLQNVEYVDYARAGFSVVFVETETVPEGSAFLSIRDAAVGARLDPELFAVGRGRDLLIENHSKEEHYVSCPEANVARLLGPGESFRIPATGSGTYQVFLLDVPGASSTVFVAPGPFAMVSTAGRFVLPNLAPGTYRLRTWHPRFPETTHDVELVADQILRVNLEIGVGQNTKKETRP